MFGKSSMRTLVEEQKGHVKRSTSSRPPLSNTDKHILAFRAPREGLRRDDFGFWIVVERRFKKKGPNLQVSSAFFLIDWSTLPKSHERSRKIVGSPIVRRRYLPRALPTASVRSFLDVLHVGELRHRRLDAVQLVLDLLQALTLRLGKDQEREEDADDAKDAEHPVSRVIAEGFRDVAREFDDEERQEPAHADGDTGRLGLDVAGEHLTHDGPGQRTPADAVGRDEDDQGDHGEPGDRLDALRRIFLEIEVKAQGTQSDDLSDAGSD